MIEVILHRFYGFGPPLDPETPLGVGPHVGSVPGSGVATTAGGYYGHSRSGVGGGGGGGGGGGSHHEPTCPTSCSTHSTTGGLVGLGSGPATSSVHAAAGKVERTHALMHTRTFTNGTKFTHCCPHKKPLTDSTVYYYLIQPSPHSKIASYSCGPSFS